MMQMGRYVRGIYTSLGVLLLSCVFALATADIFFPAPLAPKDQDLHPERIFPPPVPDDTVTLLFVGDIMLSRAIGEIMEARGDWAYPFRLTREVVSGANLAIGNLEGPIALGGADQGGVYSFRADPRAIKGLLWAGFDLVSIANNHIWDYGRDAFLETITRLEEATIATVGGGKNFDEAHRPALKEVNGTKIAFLAYTNLLGESLSGEDAEPAIAYPELLQLQNDIQKSKQIADLVVVSFHWGNEYEAIHSEVQGSLAHSAIDAGASLVVGHHPHVVQDTEYYRNAFIAYSLGNFVFDQNFSESTGRGLALRVTLKGKEISGIEELHVRFTNSFEPYFEAP